METETLERTRPAGAGMAFAFGAVTNSETNGQLVATDALTDMQEIFAERYVSNGGCGAIAAESAGYRGEHGAIGSRLLKNPKVRAKIHELVQVMLETAGAVVGQAVLFEIAQDKGAPPGVRRHCAKDLLELAGFYRDRPDGSANPRKSLAEMTRDELEAVVAQGAAVLTAATKLGPVLTGRVAPNSAQVEPREITEPLSDNA